MKVTGRKNLKSILFAGTSLVLVMSGCKLNSNAPASSEKDANSSGQSNKGNKILLDFYPIEEGTKITIQARQSVFDKVTGAEFGKGQYLCASEQRFHELLVSQSGLDKDTADRLFKQIKQPEKSESTEFNKNFEALQKFYNDHLAKIANKENSGVISCDRDEKYSSEIQEYKESPRKNDNAEAYILDKNRKFWRQFKDSKGGSRLCLITNNVESFKLSQHVEDAALAYYIREGNLEYVLADNASDTLNGNNCPGTSTHNLMRDIQKVGGEYKYWVMSTTNTKLVNAALSNSGRLKIWENIDVAFEQTDASYISLESIVTNDCYLQSGKPFNSFYAFIKLKNGAIRTIKGTKDKPESNDYPGFNTPADFIKAKNICPK